MSQRTIVNWAEPLATIIKLYEVRGSETGIDGGARFGHITKICVFVLSYLIPKKDKQVFTPSRW